MTTMTSSLSVGPNQLGAQPEAMFSHLERKARNLYRAITKNPERAVASIRDKAIALINTELFQDITKVLHVIRVGVSVLSGSYMAPYKTIVLLGRLAQASTHLYKHVTEGPAIQSTTLTHAEKAAAIAVRAVAEANFFPIALVTAAADLTTVDFKAFSARLNKYTLGLNPNVHS